MPKQLEVFYLDMDKFTRNFSFKVKQFVNINLHIALIKNTRPFDVSNCTVKLAIEGPNNYTHEFTAYQIIGNDIKFNLNEFSITGTYLGELSISDSEGTIRTPTFYFSVDKSLSNNSNIIYYSLIDSEGFSLVDSEGFILKVMS